jgi:hypothetical protein
LEVIVKVSNILKKLAFGGMLAALCASFPAAAYYGDDCCCQTNPCCTPCCNGPLKDGAFGILVKGGVTPTWFTDRGNILVTNPSIFPFVFQIEKEPNFDKLFDTPWQVGAELQWNACCNVQFFLEYAFTRAEGKKHHFFFNDIFTFRHRNRNYETSSVYLGARYFFNNIWCSECGTSSVAPFVGFKGGVAWNTNTRTRCHCSTVFGDFDFGDHDLFKNQALISAGAQIGIDWSINCNWGAMLTVEVVGTQALRNNRHLPLLSTISGAVLPPGSPTHISRGETGHLLSVPVTLGVRYTF